MRSPPCLLLALCTLVLLVAEGRADKDSEEVISAGKVGGMNFLLGIGVISRASNFRMRAVLRQGLGLYLSLREGKARLRFFIAEPKEVGEKR